MKIIRKDKKDNFTTIDNAYLQNKKLSFKAKGMPLSLILALKKILIALVILSPSSAKIFSASSFTFLSVLIFKFVVDINTSPFLNYKTNFVHGQHIVIIN